MSSDVVTYCSVKPFEIIQDYLDKPDEYNKEGLLEEDITRFGIDSDGRVICPISLDDLKVGSSCYKVDCCKKVFSQNPLENWILKQPICPLCKKHLKKEDVLTIRDRVKSCFNWDFVIELFSPIRIT